MKSSANATNPETTVIESVSVLKNGLATHNGLERDNGARDNGANGLVRNEIETDKMAEMNVAVEDSPDDTEAVESEAVESLDATDDEADGELQPCPMVWVSPERIVANPDQPRTRFTRADLRSLTQSVRQHGVLQPITVCRLLAAETTATESNGQLHDEKSHIETSADEANTDDKVSTTDDTPRTDEDASGDGMMRYQIIAGERRWRAALAAGLSLMPVIVRDGLSPTTVAEVALVENLQRTDLDPIEEARGYLRLIREFSLSEDRVAKRVGRSRESIRQSLKLLQLPKPLQELIAEGKLTPTHGQVMRKFARFPELCEAIANTCVEYEVPAASLAQEIPNDDDLLHEGLLVYLAPYNTEFDFQRVCRSCPHKAFWQDGFGRMYCLHPAEWEKKQEQARQEKLQRQHDEAARIMAQAAEDGQQTVEVTGLSPGSYRDLGSGLNPLPQGCTSSCPCRSSTELRGRKDVPVCLDPARFSQLSIEQQKREKEARVRRVSTLSERARAVIIEEWREGHWQKVAPLLASSLLRAQRPLIDEAARKLNLAFPLSSFFDRKGGDSGKWQVLVEQDADQVLALAALVLVMKEAKEAIEWSDHELYLSKAVLGQLNEPQTELPAAHDSSGEENEMNKVEGEDIESETELSAEKECEETDLDE